jgi:hypothetical protein
LSDSVTFFAIEQDNRHETALVRPYQTRQSTQRTDSSNTTTNGSISSNSKRKSKIALGDIQSRDHEQKAQDGSKSRGRNGRYSAEQTKATRNSTDPIEAFHTFHTIFHFGYSNSPT